MRILSSLLFFVLFSVASCGGSAAPTHRPDARGHRPVMAPPAGAKPAGSDRSVSALWGTDLQVVSAGDTGAGLEMELVEGLPAIAYYDNTNSNISYIRALDANGESWGEPVVAVSSATAGYFISLEVIHKRPAIAYSSLTDGHLWYVRAADKDGQSWNEPLQADPLVVSAAYLSLAEIDKRPAISYGDFDSQRVYYVCANDKSGEDWNERVSIDPEQPSLGFTSLAEVAGNPAISFQRSSYLGYARALDQDGSTWAPAIFVTPDDVNSGQYTSLLVVNGNPAVAYHDARSANLMYVRASDAIGANWQPPQVLDSTLFSGYFPSLQVVNGNPAIAYHEQNQGFNLRYLRSLDQNGDAWPAPTVVDTFPFSGFLPSLRVVNGYPAIAHYGTFDLDLLYIRADDPNGDL